MRYSIRFMWPAHRSAALALAAMLWAIPAAAPAHAATPPDQPAAGPGGSDYAHKSVTPSRHDEGDAEYWLFEPADPTPESAPVIVFMHGWGAMSPNIYGGWIEHLVRRGNIVVFPRYQAALNTPMDTFTDNAAGAIRNAINTLKLPGHVKPDETRTAYVGHSMGGLLAANLAAVAAERHLPRPRAIMCNQPGISIGPGHAFGCPLEDLSKIPADTLLITTTGDRDTVVGDRDARRIIQLATDVPVTRKAMVEYVTDTHGWPWLVADHNAPASLHHITGDLDEPRDAEQRSVAARRFAKAVFDRIGEGSMTAMDYRGYWAVFDRLTAAAWSGEHIPEALARTAEGRSVGSWSDGKPVAPLRLEPSP